MIALEVDDMARTTAYLKTKGVEVLWGQKVAQTYSRAEIYDPNGYHIELKQWSWATSNRAAMASEVSI